jgi:hypothetical protein
LHTNSDFCAFSYLAIDLDTAAHLLNNAFADAHAEPCALLVHLLVLIQSAVILENLVKVLLLDADPTVLNDDLKLYKLMDLFEADSIRLLILWIILVLVA